MENIKEYQHIKILATLNDELIHQLLIIYLTLSIEVKIGNLKKTNIKCSTYLLTDAKNLEDESIVRLKNKYPTFSLEELILNYATWQLIIFDGWLDEKIIHKEIKNSHFYHLENNAEWQKLYFYLDFKNDDEFYQCYEEIKVNLDNKKYKNIYIIFHLAGMFMSFSKDKLIEQSLADLYQYFYDYINFLVKRNFFAAKFDNYLFKNHFLLAKDSSYGLVYHGKDILEYQNLISYAEKIHEDRKEIIFQKEANKLLQTDVDQFYKYITPINGNRHYQEIPILAYISIEELFNFLLQLTHRQIMLIFSALKERMSLYSGVEDSSLFQPEKDWLEKFKQQIVKEIKNNKNKIARVKFYYAYKNKLKDDDFFKIQIEI